jgi:hypothetical protein
MRSLRTRLESNHAALRLMGRLPPLAAILSASEGNLKGIWEAAIEAG